MIGAPTPGLSQQQPPTATELFALRSECAQLGQKELHKIEANYAEGVPYDFFQKSRYDPTTGHCYVEVDRSSTDMNGIPYQFYRYLYDGHTGEFLAWTWLPPGGGNMDGNVYDPRASCLSLSCGPDAEN